MFVWYDFEFLERGPKFPIIPISVGMVREDGKQLYLINGEFGIDAFLEHDWLRENVAPHLPLRWAPGTRIAQDGTLADGYMWDEDHEDYDNVWSLDVIAQKVETFILGDDPKADPPELWGWFPSYDHVCLAQLFGRMVDLPAGFPKRTNDIQQVADMMGVSIDTTRDADEHHALDDALWTRGAFVDLMDTAMRLTMQAFGSTAPTVAN